MTTKLSTTLRHIQDIPNAINREPVQEFHQYLVGNCTSDAYQSQMIKIMNAYGNHIGANVTFYQVIKQEQIIYFSIRKSSHLKKVQTKNGKLLGTITFGELSSSSGGCIIVK